MTQVVGIFRGSEKGEEHIALDGELQWFSCGPFAIRGTPRYAQEHREAMIPVDSDSDAGPADRALDCLRTFRARTLPAFWRQIGSWWGIAPGQREELAMELEQELALDCLEHPTEILALTDRARHRRWMRLAQHKLYQLHSRQARRSTSSESLDWLLDSRGHAPQRPLGELELDRDQQALLARLLAGAEYHANGRLSIRGTARNSGIHPERLKKLWISIAAKLGQDDDWLERRCRRIAELLCSIAGNRMRQRPSLELLPPVAEPDAGQHRLRLRRILRSLDGRPLPAELRALRQQLRRSNIAGLAQLPPRDLCVTALAIAPDRAAAAMWLAEAERQSGDLRAALRALRQARTLGVARATSCVTRARLLFDRGCRVAALRLLERSERRNGPDPRIHRAARELADDAHSKQRWAPSLRRLKAERERTRGA